MVKLRAENLCLSVEIMGSFHIVAPIELLLNLYFDGITAQIRTLARACDPAYRQRVDACFLTGSRNIDRRGVVRGRRRNRARPF